MYELGKVNMNNLSDIITPNIEMALAAVFALCAAYVFHVVASDIHKETMMTDGLNE